MTWASPAHERSLRPEVISFLAGATGLFASISMLTLMVLALVPGLVPGWGSSVVVSGSMEPALREGDVIAYRPMDPRTIGMQSIIVFNDAERGSWVVHRVVDVNASGLVTKGDANNAPDTRLVLPDQVIGVAFMVVPWAGLPRLWWAQGQWYFSVLLILVAVGTAIEGGRLMRVVDAPWPARPPSAVFLHASRPEVARLVPEDTHARILRQAWHSS
ncbi:MAG: signal peptidase I [Candidatus Nanopelagicales bacterium]